MQVEIITHSTNLYLLLPKAGDAAYLFLKHIAFYHSIDVQLRFNILPIENLPFKMDDFSFCIQLIGTNNNKLDIFFYELFQAYINNNLISDYLV